MKIFLVCSKHNYHYIPEIQEKLESLGHIIELPNSYDEPLREERYKEMGPVEHAEWKAQMIRDQERKVARNDALVVLNFEKNGVPNYIGGATFLEIFQAWRTDKKVYFYNPLPDLIFTDELKAMQPTVINGDLFLVK